MNAPLIQENNKDNTTVPSENTAVERDVRSARELNTGMTPAAFWRFSLPEEQPHC
jgi:hypothetical protein